ncbi:MAG: DMT family transporter [Proteobacteria bacterium]|nr:DMT family transporter [Pseudomonadota bacterium]
MPQTLFQKHSKGILSMLLAFFFFGIGNALVKDTTQTYSISQILSIRSFTILLPLLFYIFFIQKKTKPFTVFKTENLKSHFFRGFLVIVSLWCIFAGLGLLPLANATVLGFTNVLFMSIISIPFLKEKVSFPQWIAIFIGFSGVLVIARPGSDLSNFIELGAIFMLIGGLLDGMVLLYPRKMGKKDSVLTILVYYALFSLFFGLCLMVFEGWVPIASSEDLLFLVGVGFFSLLGQLFATQAFQYAPAGLLSPLIYSILIWSALFGYLIWGEIPDIYTFIGAAILIGSGCYVIYKSPTQATITEEIPLSPEGGHG